MEVEYNAEVIEVPCEKKVSLFKSNTTKYMKKHLKGRHPE